MTNARKSALVGCLILAAAAAFGAWVGDALLAAVIAGCVGYLIVEAAAWFAAKAYGTPQGPP